MPAQRSRDAGVSLNTSNALTCQITGWSNLQQQDQGERQLTTLAGKGSVFAWSNVNQKADPAYTCLWPQGLCLLCRNYERVQ